MKNIRRVLAVGLVQIKVHWTPNPPHWRSSQMVSNSPYSLGAQLKQQRIELHQFQADLAKRLLVRVVCLGNWERGASQLSRRMQISIIKFLGTNQLPIWR